MKHKTKYLTEYRKPDYTITSVHLTFSLEDEKTLVSSRMEIASTEAEMAPLVLDGENLELVSVRLNGKDVRYVEEEGSLRIENPPASFTLEIENYINPQANTTLEGLYKSGSIFCTQNEPEGFRRITYFLDRPDVMARYTTKIIADKKLYPHLLSNGNLISSGDVAKGKHFAEWEDPFPKPSYLFALVAGDLGFIEDSFTTRSGRNVVLRIFSEKGNESKCRHAMDSLKKSMKWDEDVFGLEYDLDIFMIVAVNSFNMGAMENKGLNIFNTSCILADVQSATDENYLRVEGVVAHEYFHNWTGDRVTCRDWFQLTLKEGLTVFRDQEFSSDVNVRGIKRIEDVSALRTLQFPEDEGPLSHPIQPASYIEMNNFYTSTVYKKGAEVIRMIHTLIGPQAFRKGMDTYFKLYDGQAVTTEDFVHAMEVGSGRDFRQFRRWYSQNKTPVVSVKYSYDAGKRTFTIHTEQLHLKERGQNPFHFPFAVALFGSDGTEVEKRMLEVTEEKQSFAFTNIHEQPVVSLNRSFSAPVIVKAPLTRNDYTFLMTYDTDEFNRWDSGQELASQLIIEQVEKGSLELDSNYVAAFGHVIKNRTLHPSVKAYALALPSESQLAFQQDTIDFDGIHRVREGFIRHLAEVYKKELTQLYNELSEWKEYSIDPLSMGKRRLKNGVLFYLASLGERGLVKEQFDKASNMTDRFAALVLLSHVEGKERKEAFAQFYDEWKDDLLTINKWFAAIAASKRPSVLAEVKQAMKDPVFDMTVPNMVRALIGTFADNHVHFHTANGYAFMADQVIALDMINPLMASRMGSLFQAYRKLDSKRKPLMKAQLERVLAQKGLSDNTFEVISKTLA